MLERREEEAARITALEQKVIDDQQNLREKELLAHQKQVEKIKS